jgi:hypothetical protein
MQIRYASSLEYVDKTMIDKEIGLECARGDRVYEASGGIQASFH